MSPRCGACGGTLKGRTFQGRSAQVCTACGSVLVGAEDAVFLLGPPAPLPDDQPVARVGPTPAPSERAEEGPSDRSQLWMFGVGVALLVFAAGAVALVFLVQQQGTQAPAETTPPDEEAVPAATASNVQKLVSEGWTLVADDPGAAADRFRAALELTPRDGAASYGLGYALLRTGARDEATQHLCRAKSYADRETSREVVSLLEHEGIACP